MSVAATTPDAAEPQVLAQGSLLKVRPLGLSLGAWAALVILGLVLLVAAFGPLLAPHDPNAINLSQQFYRPTGSHLLGQDATGRDLLSRLLVGARTAVVGPLLVVVLSTILGTAIALVSVWVGGWLDALTSRIIDAIFAFPGLLLAILATSLFGVGLKAAVIALAIAYTPYIARIVRSAALRERNLPYVSALQVQGLRAFTICVKHLLPNVGTLIVANATLSFGFALIDLAGLSFIGLGVQAPTADWGAMVGAGVSGLMQGFPEESLYASVLIVLTVGAANYLGDKLVERAEARR